MLIRRATLDDSPAIAVLVKQLAEVTHDAANLTAEELRANLTRLLDSPDSLVLVAEDSARLIGLLSLTFRHTLYHPAPSALIDELVVDTSRRGQGVGQQLVAAAIAEAKRRGCAEIEVSTEPTNTKAQRCYRRAGFTHTAVLLEMEFEED